MAAFGAPLVPPGRLTRLLTRLRGAIAGTHRSLGPPPVRILEGMFGLVDNRVLGLLVELDVPEHLDRPRPVGELAAATGTDPARLERILRYAAGRGFLAHDRHGRFRPNAVTTRLRADHPNSWRAWVEFGGSDWFWSAWRHVPASLAPGGPSGLEAATGAPFFEYVHHENVAGGRAFDAAMEAGAAVQGLALASALSWRGVQTVCDVGGGSGAALEALLTCTPHLHATLFDLPEVVAKAPPSLVAGALGDRCTTVGGDFFEEVPPGIDRYLLLAVVHDWDDDRALQILTNVRRAMSPGAEAVVVDWLLPDRPRDEFSFAADLLMLALADGRERRRAEFSELFTAAGLRLRRRRPLASGSSAFVLTPKRS